MLKFSIVLMILIAFSCDKKLPDIPKDPRDNFTGKYIGTHSWDYSGHPDLCRISHGTDSTTIIVTKGKTDTTLSAFGTELCKINDSTYDNCKYGEYSITIKNNHIRASSGRSGTVCRWSDIYEGIK